MKSMEGSLEENNSPLDIEVCPHLGLLDDPKTRLMYAAPGNFCHRIEPPQSVVPAYQVAICLTEEEYKTCSVFQGTWQSPAPEKKPRRVLFRRIRLNPWKWVSVILIALLIVILILGVRYYIPLISIFLK